MDRGAPPTLVDASASPGAFHGIQFERLGPLLAEFDGTRAESELQRLAADTHLVDAMMWAGYSGPIWDAFCRALAEYGFQIIQAWCRSGRIFVESQRKGFGGLPGGRRTLERDDATELAAETVAASIAYFRDKVLVPRLWDPNRGASLKTFFIGTCILGFARVYRVWYRETRTLPLSEGASLSTIESSVLSLIAARDALNQLSAPEAELMSYLALGYSHLEIAELIGTTAKAVERRIQRTRAKLGGAHETR